MGDLRRRAKDLDAGDGSIYCVYGKLLAWRDLAHAAIEQLEIMESRIGTTEETQVTHGEFMENPVCKDAVNRTGDSCVGDVPGQGAA
jgi:hypothetical protein